MDYRQVNSSKLEAVGTNRSGEVRVIDVHISVRRCWSSFSEAYHFILSSGMDQHETTPEMKSAWISFILHQIV